MGKPEPGEVKSLKEGVTTNNNKKNYLRLSLLSANNLYLI